MGYGNKFWTYKLKMAHNLRSLYERKKKKKNTLREKEKMLVATIFLKLFSDLRF